MSGASASRSGRLRNPNLAVFKTWLSQTNDFKIDTCSSLAWYSALLGYGKDWLAQYQDNATEGDSRSWCQWSGVLLRQLYKVAMSARCYK